MAHPPKRLISLLAIALVVVAAVMVLRAMESNDALILSGTVEATEAHLGFPMAGRIDSILVREGDHVTRGQLLAVLESDEARARRDQAGAQVASSRAVLDEMLEGSRAEEIAAAEAARDGARRRWEDALRDRDRAGSLRDGGAISEEALDKARVAEQVSRTQLDAAEEQLRLVRSGPRRQRIVAQEAQLRQSQATLEGADAALANTRITAPMEGVVSLRHREEGEIVPAGGTVLSLQNLADRWIRVFVPEARLAAVRIGAPAVITNDTFPGRSYRGEVAFIASEAEFTPKTVQTKEERVKLVFAVKVRVTEDLSIDLKPGMPADVDLRLNPR